MAKSVQMYIKDPTCPFNNSLIIEIIKYKFIEPVH